MLGLIWRMQDYICFQLLVPYRCRRRNRPQESEHYSDEMNPNRRKRISVVTNYLPRVDFEDESEGKQGYGLLRMGFYHSKREKLTGGEEDVLVQVLPEMPR